MASVLKLVANAYDAITRARISNTFAPGTGIDTKRAQIWDQFGYPQSLTFNDYLKAYERTGAGFGAVHRLLEKCWSLRPRIKIDVANDKLGPWEKQLEDLLEPHWPRLRDFDRRNMVGRYAGLILRVADGKTLDQPLQRAAELTEVIPVYGEGQLKVEDWVSDKDDPNYGQPAMFAYRVVIDGQHQAADQQGRPDDWRKVHPTRVLILAEGSAGHLLDGVPLLQPGYNKLVDLDKIEGGTGEGIFKNSARHTIVEFQAEASPAKAIRAGLNITKNGDQPVSQPTLADAVEEQVKALNTSHDAAMMLQGAKAYPLSTAVVSPLDAWTVSANSFACSVQIPFTILFGQQTGRLASDQDKQDMNERCDARRTTLLTPMLRDLVNRLILMGLIPEQKFVIEWPDLGAPTEDRRLTNMKTMADAAKVIVDTGLPPPFDLDEFRRVGGYDPQESEPEVREGGPLDPNAPDPVVVAPGAKPGVPADPAAA